MPLPSVCCTCPGTTDQPLHGARHAAFLAELTAIFLPDD